MHEGRRKVLPLTLTAETKPTKIDQKASKLGDFIQNSPKNNLVFPYEYQR